jgi:hypothetical protein
VHPIWTGALGQHREFTGRHVEFLEVELPDRPGIDEQGYLPRPAD